MQTEYIFIYFFVIFLSFGNYLRNENSDIFTHLSKSLFFIECEHENNSIKMKKIIKLKFGKRISI